MRLNVLDRVEAFADGDRLLLGGPKHRAILRYLALRANTVVSMDELLAALWGQQPPRTARKMVQSAISDLRAVLAQEPDPDAQAFLLTHAPGYLLRIDPEQVDALCFIRAVRDGLARLRDGDSEAGLRMLRSALERWPAPVAPDPAAEHWAELQELRRLRTEAGERISAGVPDADGAGVLMAITAHVEAALDQNAEQHTRQSISVLRELNDEITLHGGRVHTEFGSLCIAVFEDGGRASGHLRANAAADAVRTRLTLRRAQVSVVLLPLADKTAGPRTVPDSLIERGIRLLATAPAGAVLAA